MARGDPQRRPALRTTAERNALVEQYQWLPLWFARRWWRLDTFGPDELQELFIALMRAADLWDPAQSVFPTYAVAAMRGKALALGVAAVRTALPLLDEVAVNVPAPPGYDATALPDEVQAALAGLDERARAALWRNLCEGASLNVVAQELGISPERVRQIRNAALATLRGLLRRDGAA